jgi:hypothetical protein
MTKWPRERTHFAPLSAEVVGSGTRQMFNIHPELLDYRALSPATRAFLIGYISHLAADEVWISTIFRCYFDKHTMIADNEVTAHIWDRALQLDMDRKIRGELDTLCRPSDTMVMSEQGVDLPFIRSEMLLEWRQWACQFMGWGFTWDRLKRTLSRMYRNDDEVQMQVDRFICAIPDSLASIYDRMPEEKLAEYQLRATEEALIQVREYWDET